MAERDEDIEWRGKRLKDMTREELIRVIGTLGRLYMDSVGVPRSKADGIVRPPSPWNPEPKE